MGVKKNFLYSSILTTAGYIFPLITFPYVSRVLGVTNIGICNFVDSIINYFVLFSMLGIQNTGIREIARKRGDRTGLSKAFYSIIGLNIILVIIVATTLVVSIQVVPQFAEHKALMYIGLAKLLFASSMIDWFYRGLENFRYITIRNIVIRCFFVVAVFVFIREKDDYVIYFALAAITEGLNALVNCIHARKYLTFVLKDIHPLKYLKSCLTLGSYSLLTSMYTSFNVVFLGFVTNTTEVGLYATATKLHKIIIGFLLAFTAVMLPRMSNLLAEGKTQEFREKISKSFSVLIYFSFPLIVISSVFASEIIDIISGSGYEKAAIPLTIIMPLVFIIGFEQILVVQILIALKKDRVILVNAIIGAIVGVMVNLLIVKSMGCVGSSLAWLLSEVSVMISAVMVAKRYFPLSSTTKKILVNILYSIPAVIVCLALKHFDPSHLRAMFVASFFVAAYYGCLHLFVIKDKDLLELIPKKITPWRH
ncbi:MAG: flippase [Prevotella sp.]|nr:flippase [Prevotella sp.]